MVLFHCSESLPAMGKAASSSKLTISDQLYR